jgi:hypothetical protein
LYRPCPSWSLESTRPAGRESNWSNRLVGAHAAVAGCHMQVTTVRHTSAFAFAIAASLAVALVLRAQDTPGVPYPHDFRSWTHVKSIVVGPEHKSFANRGATTPTISPSKVIGPARFRTARSSSMRPSS